MHAGHTLGDDAAWNLRRKEPQTCGLWWRPQQSLFRFPEPGRVMEEGQTAGDEDKNPAYGHMAMSGWPAPRLWIMTAEPSLHLTLSLPSNCIWRPSGAQKPRLPRGVKRVVASSCQTPRSTCVCSKASVTRNQGLHYDCVIAEYNWPVWSHGATPPASVSWSTIPGASAAENRPEVQIDFEWEYTLQISNGFTSWTVAREPL